MTVVAVRPVPALEPPFDDEVGTTQPPAGMDLLPIFEAGAPARDQPPELLPRPGTTTNPQIPARRFAEVCTEVLNGFRPITQLRRSIAPDRYHDVEAQLTRRAARLTISAARTRTNPRPARIHVRQTLVSRPTDTVIEAVAVLDRGDRAWAMPFRLERREQGWTCVLLKIL